MSCSDHLTEYLAGWSAPPLQSNSSLIDTYNRRPRPVTLSNVTANTALVGHANIEDDSKNFGRIVAISHVGLSSAALGPRNGLAHSGDLENAGSSSAEASLITIISNALCINADADELKPLLSGSLNETKDLWAVSNNHTTLDDIFQCCDRIENDTIL
ncbi:hypothetical protein HBI56_230920 [Parastagonospora nodorum]|uniref:Uncharacterized protein n=1 Tax=Phaeosphaeria nodorum (strain SN15 / ATCC MYA-4574 / FGSC 10173) TaxID=321614 RepID=A0A7U2FFS3_PHANO|nr:hypothetical protein HBH56_223860 [Parastagonospora nodorum]QRD04333.1 hypothetical protein JI435_309620 [Parastagonospora nodorum SN15]KAH3921895.1 hypothetical protein HBH54_232010 [Parastagonospora nodorum]KAH3939409.1 hypothetical protein HBH53_234790 [Parastagonospora nodorum]KAH4081681.1 hypothetical protein HBH46_224450 [Parastagonospora nodorum]